MLTAHQIVTQYVEAGFSYRFIAKHFKLSAPTIHEMHHRSDYPEYADTRVRMNALLWRKNSPNWKMAKNGRMRAAKEK